MTSAEVVLLTPVLPARTGGGLAMRAGVLLEGLARSHRVRVVVAPVLGERTDDGELARRHAEDVHVLDLDGPADPRAHITALLATPGGRERAGALPPRPRPCALLTPATARQVAHLASGAAAVWTLRLYLAPLLDALLDAAARPRLALDVDDLDAVVARRIGAPAEAEAYERLERYYLPRVELVTTAATRDAATLARTHGLSRAVAVPNAVRVPDRADTDGPIAHDMLFVGDLSYLPNAEAAHWIATELRPRLGAPRIALVGRGPTPEVCALAALDGVTVDGDVPDVAPSYARSRIAVAPLTAGGGTRIKILEALAHGRPVVATPLAAEGLGLGLADGVVVAERDEDFAAVCRALLDDPARADRLGAAGRAAVRRRASAARVAEAIDALARSMLRA